MGKHTREFKWDDKADAALKSLMSTFQVDSYSEVMKRALSLSRIAEECADKDGVVTFVASDGSEREVALRDNQEASGDSSR